MRILILLLPLFLAANVALAAKRPMTVDDQLNIVKVGDVRISPNGKQIFYSKTELVWEENDYKSSYYMASAKDGKATQYIGEAGGQDFQFSPDGQYLAMMREVDEAPQIFVMPTSGGEAVQLTHHRGAINSYKWTPDASTIIFIADEPRSEEEEKEHKLGADPVFVDEAPNGKEEERFSNLWSFDLKTKKEARLSEANLMVIEFDISQDGSRIVLVGAPDNRANYGHLSELYLLEIDSKKMTRLTHNEAPEGDLVWAPDGKTFAYRAPSDTDFALRSGYFWIMNPDTGDNRRLEAQNQGAVSFLSDNETVWTEDGKYLLYTEQQRTHSNLYKLEVKTDEASAISEFPGIVTNVRFSKDRKQVVYGYEDITTPRDLYVSEIAHTDNEPVTGSASHRC